MHIEKELQNYIFNQFIPRENPKKFNIDDDLIEEGILDSLAIVHLITHLEEIYQIEVEAGEVVVDNIGSIRRLTDYIKHKLGSQ
ncbi:MAG: acyl carrier protein [Candidatus Scalinduaceae bacterium]